MDRRTRRRTISAEEATAIVVFGLGSLLSSRLLRDVLGIPAQVDDQTLVDTWVQIMTVTLTGPRPPTIDPIPEQTKVACAPKTFALSPFVHSSLPVSYAIAGAATGVSIEPATGVLTTLTDMVGSYPLTLTVTSDAGQTATSFTLTVTAPPCLLPLLRCQGWGC